MTTKTFPPSWAINSAVDVVRLDGAEYVVTAYDLFGKVIRERAFRCGSRRREMAMEQARRWADKYYLWFDGKVWD